MNQKAIMYWVFQLSGWGFLVFISLLKDFQSNSIINTDSIRDSIIIMLLGISVTHLYRIYIIKRDWLLLKVIQIIPRIFCGAIVNGAILLFLTQMVSMLIKKPIEIDLFQVFQNLIGQFITITIWSVIYFAFHFIERSRNQEIENLQLESSKQEAELNNLKSQLNPHFMFNSLNNIRALIDEDPLLAKNSVSELSNLLRASLNTSRKSLIPLKEELSIVKDYLNLEKIRYEDRLTVKMNIEKSSRSFLIPPLLIQTLVENAIKHGISKLKNGGEISVSTFIKNKLLEIIIINDGEYIPPMKKHTGLGIKNSKKRIELIYGGNYSFTIKNKNAQVITQINIPVLNK